MSAGGDVGYRPVEKGRMKLGMGDEIRFVWACALPLAIFSLSVSCNNPYPPKTFYLYDLRRMDLELRIDQIRSRKKNSYKDGGLVSVSTSPPTPKLDLTRW